MLTGDRMPELGRRGSAERRLAERRAVIEAHVELALRSMQASLESGWMGPEHSPLGHERHVAAVERRMARSSRHRRGPVDAAIVAGRHLLTIDAVASEFFHEPSTTPRRAMTLARALAALGRVPPGNDNG